MSGIDLRPIAHLARLRFKDEELKVFEAQVNDILKLVNQLAEVPVEGVEPTSHPLALKNVFREDQPSPSLPIEEFLKASPRTRGRFFEVPKIIENTK